MFKMYENFETLPDSMCFDSGTKICTYTDGEDTVAVEVRGYVTVCFKEEIYTHYSDMPKELQELFQNGTAYDDERVVINENNWYEMFLNHDQEYDVAEIDGMPQADLEGYCKAWLEEYRKDIILAARGSH